MAVSFSGFPWWFRSVGKKDKQLISNESSLISSSSSSDTVKFQTKISPSKGKWPVGEKTRVVQSDGLLLSGHESDGPEWSIGWEEPHGPGFQVNDDDGGGFAVLVPCYKPGCKELVQGPNNHLLSAIKNLSNDFSSEGRDSIQQWFPYR
ncbi:Haloacid dehalogenase-like hydrolase superfamily protein isoform 1 [Hibiscus syriacus]|uniref:Haloacid dehalogenase-like hydrolase superfamily protein isoform 1 n=1 Tax=Hibiscus syriacus TaxID=106335 RepID=A0A6A3BND5_HIBSY|nr:Haloacid dehalogenase-like hydrolase superfamily protein isoform 1 [Hibiscus syriacus]